MELSHSIECHNLSKKFSRNLKTSLKYGVRDMVSSLCLRAGRSDVRTSEFLALDDVSFSLKAGEALGLIGRNGSGKTTLLKVLAGILAPDSGHVRVSGRVGSLVALGAGFSPVLTGRENIRIGLSIRGFSQREIALMEDEIIDFAEIRHAIDAPVRTYSSGMSARLGFACVTNIRPDLLLVDEVLAVGDLSFRVKSTEKLEQLRSAGCSIVLVSHNSAAILGACDTCLWLDSGKIRDFGDAFEVFRRYEDANLLGDNTTELPDWDLSSEENSVSRDAKITRIFATDLDGNVSHLRAGTDRVIIIQGEAKSPLSFVSTNMAFSRVGTEGDYLHLSSVEDNCFCAADSGSFEIRVTLPALSMAPGHYVCSIWLHENGLRGLDAATGLRFLVEPGNRLVTKSLVYQERDWHMSQMVSKDT